MTEILNRKTAKRLLLINWSCFQNEIIELGSSTLFTGVNGTGKTTSLDAMLYLLTANKQFNKSADDKDRNVTAYIHGDRKTNGADRYLRKDAVTSYIAMEFFDPTTKKYFVVAVCMESKNPQDPAESKWIIFDDCKFEDINFYDRAALKEKRFVTTARNNLTVKGVNVKAGDFLGREKAVEQVKRVLGIRGDSKKFREKLLKMTAFDPERNVDKFLQDSVLADVPVHSLELLREQKKLYEEARAMFENIKTRKNLRVAFVNVLDAKQIVPIYMGLYKMKFVYNSPNIEMEICYSKVQGKEQLLRRFFLFPQMVNHNFTNMYQGFQRHMS